VALCADWIYRYNRLYIPEEVPNASMEVDMQIMCLRVIVKATFKSGVGEKIVPLFFTLLLAFHLVLILVMHD